MNGKDFLARFPLIPNHRLYMNTCFAFEFLKLCTTAVQEDLRNFETRPGEFEQLFPSLSYNSLQKQSS